MMVSNPRIDFCNSDISKLCFVIEEYILVFECFTKTLACRMLTCSNYCVLSFHMAEIIVKFWKFLLFCEIIYAPGEFFSLI